MGSILKPQMPGIYPFTVVTEKQNSVTQERKALFLWTVTVTFA